MTPSPSRIAQLKQRMAEHELPALLVSGGTNRRYLSGFTGSAGLLLVVLGDAETHLVVDSRYDEQAAQQAPDLVIERAGYAQIERVGELLAELGIERLGFEAGSVTVEQLQRFKKKLPETDWQAATGLVESLRACKDAGEIEAIGKAVALTDRAMEHAYAIARPGMLERELAWEIEVFMRENGAEALAFDTIVASGPNGALPHHHPGETALAAGQPIVIDMGAQVDGYCGDLTRTICIGPADDSDYDRVYAIVDEANRKASAGLTPGLTGPAVDSLARDHIAEAGYGERFGHSLGHGVGLNVHEAPRLSQKAGDKPLKPGMVVTIEPGIYLPGRFGVRIEDMAVLREGGADVLSRAAKLSILEPAASLA